MRDSEDVIAAWRSDLNRILQVFDVCSVCLCLITTDPHPPVKTELTLNTHTFITDIRQHLSKIREDAGDPGEAVSDTRTFYYFPTHSNDCLD